MEETLKPGPGEQALAALAPAHDDRALTRWQTRLLTLMKGMVVGLTAFFFLASGAQLLYLQQRIGSAPQVNVNELLVNLPSKAATTQETIELARVKTMIALEANTLERRHHQANVSLMAYVWIRYLGFVTGMILALVGAAFILGKLQEGVSEVNAKVGGAEGALKSSSPGLVLAILGTALMLTTVIVKGEIVVNDVPVYTRTWWSSTPSDEPGTATAPPALTRRESPAQ